MKNEGTMKRLTMCGAVALAMAAMGGEAVADVPLTQFAYQVRPTPGVYYDPTQSGTGLTIDTVRVGNQDFVFSTYYHYAASGDPTWMNFGAYAVQSTIADYTATGLPAYIRSQFNRSTGGQCFDCAFTSPTTTTPTLGTRDLKILSSKHLLMPASGNAADRNMRLAKAIPPSGTQIQALLDSGSVWSIKWRRASSGGDIEDATAGWIYFQKRPDNQKLTFGANVLNQQEPEWLRVTDKNASVQYEIVPALSPTQVQALPLSLQDAIGFIVPPLLGQENTVQYEDDLGTIIIDPVTSKARHYLRCTSNVSWCVNWNLRTNVTIQYVSDIIEAGPDAQGADRMLLRQWSHPTNGVGPGWTQEYEFTRIPNALARAVAPGLPTGIASQ